MGARPDAMLARIAFTKALASSTSYFAGAKVVTPGLAKVEVESLVDVGPCRVEQLGTDVCRFGRQAATRSSLRQRRDGAYRPCSILVSWMSSLGPVVEIASSIPTPGS